MVYFIFEEIKRDIKPYIGIKILNMKDEKIKRCKIYMRKVEWRIAI